MRAARLLAFATLTGLAAGAQQVPYTLPCGWTDKACAREAIRNHPVRRVEAWTEAFQQPVERRFGPAPPVLVEALALDNIANGFPERPRAAQPPEDFMRDVREAIEELPAPVRKLLGSELAGIYFVEELGGTGFSNAIRDASGPVGAFVALDSAVLARRTANKWATWKENTPFKPDPAYTLRARIQAAANDKRKYAIQYILLHELGHVLSVRSRVHPDWELAPRDVPPHTEYPFFQLSWRVARADNRYESLFDADFPERKDVVYYLAPKLPGKDMAKVYDKLAKTNFPTLYAAIHPGDDFAEAFANYVHVVLMKRPFAIEILERGRVIKTYGPCWDHPRCGGKRRILEALLSLSDK